MISLCLTSPQQPTFLPPRRPIRIPIHTTQLSSNNKRRLRNGKCRAELLSADAPVALAIGACILNSLIFPLSPSKEDTEAESLIDSADARFAVMGIISFIPYFNWMSWVFAWMDTGNQRYGVYAIVYLAPYLRSNFSISPEDSWLPIASILLCILHIQLEVSIKNGDLQSFQVFNDVAKRLSSFTGKKNQRNVEEVEREDFHNLPSVNDKYRDDIRDWAAPQKPNKDHKILNEDEEGNEGSKH